MVRSGPTVRRPVQPWTPAVHALLRHLADVGFAAAPRVLGVDGDTEVLSYLPGASGPEGWARVVDENGLRGAARLLRDHHEAVRGWQPAEPPVWATGPAGTGGPGELVCHGDYGPWNLVWDGVRSVGLLDWEYAHVGSPLLDVAYALEYVVPFRDDAECLRWLRYPAPPDRRRRLELFAAAYGLTSTEGLVEEVLAVQRLAVDRVLELAARGQPRQVAQVAEGFPEVLRERISWTERHRHLVD
ncbi:aminoglycoside phosphotransferase family protein [Desertihabitans brevis]|uniref:Aminoglycoside phosphotransferase family protein n=1 Tax=Desertihabitans brevis TaxID=2268447 RepID=A0A367Z041_9ACTN|nr:aminoglycoside phosphotransferase family protein [Desertihabitans brevis]